MTTDPVITSVANRRVKDAASLQQRKARDATARYLAEGPNAVDEAVAEGAAEAVFATADFAPRYHGVARDLEVVEVVDHVLEKIATTRTPQGVVAVVRQRLRTLDDVVGRGFLIVLDRVADPGNAGTIIRTADALGATGLVLTAGSVDPFNPKAVRASAGSIVRLPLVTGVSVADLLSACGAVGQRVVAFDARAPRTIREPGLLDPPVVLLFGSEAHGLDIEAVEGAGDIVAIPRFGRAESLNLAVAVGVAAYVAATAVHGSDRARRQDPIT